MKKVVLFWLSTLILASTMISNANSVIEVDSSSYVWETLFKEEDTILDNKTITISTNNNSIQNINETIKIQNENNEWEYELAKKFVRKYELLWTQYNDHEILSDKDFVSATSNFINLVLWWKTNIIQGTEYTRKNFMLLISRPVMQQCENESCVLDFIKKQNIASITDSDRNLTYYEANLLLRRTYIQYKAKSFEQNALQDSQININQLIKSSRFNDFELIQYTNDRKQFYKSAYKKTYGEIQCYYNSNKNITSIACTYSFENNPFYTMEIDTNKSSIQELMKLSSMSNELYLGQLSYY